MAVLSRWMTGVRATLRGRDDEIAQMSRSTRDAGVVAIVGEPGIGKSALWAEGVASQRVAGARVLVATCTYAESEMPYALLDQLVGSLLGDYPMALAPVQHAALDAALFPGGAGERADRRTVAAAVLALFRRALDDGPLVLAIDDLQWSDADTLHCLTYALRRLDGRGPILLLTARTASPLWRPERRVTVENALADLLVGVPTISLSGLPPPAIRQMVLDRYGTDLGPDECRRVAGLTGGNAFWALECTRGGPEAHKVVLPSRSLGALASARTEGLDGRAIDIACLVAALGRAPLDAVLRSVTPSGGEDVVAEDVVDAAVSAQLVTLSGARLVPSHPLIASALLAALPPLRRRRLHLRAAALADSVEGRAVHLLLAGAGCPETETPRPGRLHPEEILDALDLAATVAERRGAPSTAASFASQALAIETQIAQTAAPDEDGGRPRLPHRRVRAAELHHRAGDSESVLKLLDPIDLGALEEELLERAVPLLAQTRSRCRGPRAGQAVTEKVENLPRGAAEDSARREALIATLRADLWCGASGDRRVPARHAVECADVSAVSPSVRRRAIGALAVAQLDAGEPVDEALARLRAVDGLHPNGNDETIEIELLDGMRMLSIGDRAGARRVLEAEFARHLLRGDTPAAVRSASVLTQAELAAGRPREALETLARLWDHADPRAQRNPPIVYARGLVHLARGEHDELDGLLDRVGDDGTAMCGLLFVAHLRGLLCLRRDEPGAAVLLLRRCADHADAHGIVDPQRRLAVDVDLADGLLMLEEFAGAADVASRLAAALERTEQAVTAGQHRRLLAQLAMRRDGDLPRAEALAEEAAEFHRSSSLPVEYGRSLMVLAEVHRLGGASATASTAARTARQTFAHAGQTWWERAAADLCEVRAPGTELSAGEMAVVEVVRGGATNREAAAVLHLSVRTVENHLARVYRKLGIRSRSELQRSTTAAAPAG